MQNLTHAAATTEGKATEAIFNACRANPQRNAKGAVTFRLMANGNHEAALRDNDGVVIAIAHVDEFDN